MAPGEVRQISDGTTVTATFTTATGQIQTVPISLGAVSIASEHVISLSPDAQSAELGSRSSYTVQLTNPYSIPVTYNLTTVGLDGFSVGLASSITVPAGQTVTTPLDLTIPLTSAAITNGFEVLASTTSGVSDSVEGELTVMPLVDLRTFAISPSSSTGSGTDAPPHVKEVRRFGYHAMPTTLVLTFTGPLDPATAKDARNYKLIGIHGNRIAIKRAIYDSTRMTVTLRPAHRISIHHTYTLFLRSGTPGGLTDAQGQSLGSSEELLINSHELVLGAVTPQFLARYGIGRPIRSFVARKHF